MGRLAFVSILVSVLGQFAIAQEGRTQRSFDEIFERSGQLRPQYQGIYQQLEQRTKAERKRFLDESLKAYSGDNKLHDVPLILTADEFDNVIAPGVEQRLRAILMFLADEYSGVRSYRKVVPEKVITKIMKRNGELMFRKYLDGKTIAYFYGPDMMRKPRGEHVFLEDNGGAVGLAFDMRLAHNFMLDNNPAILEHFRPRDPETFYRRLAQEYKERAERAGGKAVLLVAPVRTDGEDKRVREIFADYGIETVYPNGRDLKLVSYDHGVYTYSKSKGIKSMEKVGFVILSADPVWYDNTHPATYERSVIEEAKDILNGKGVSKRLREKIADLLTADYSAVQIEGLAAAVKEYEPALLAPKPYPGLMNAVLNGLVGTNITPGAEFVSDKEFYIYLEDLIRFYLHEEPIIRNQSTWLFATASGELRESVFNRCFDNFEHYVIKPVDGRAGEGVAVGPNTARSEIPKLKAKVRANPTNWLCQEYLAPSWLDGLIVDRRVIANGFVSHGRMSSVVANVPACRGNDPEGSGRVNLCGDGRAVTTLIPACDYRLRRRH